MQVTQENVLDAAMRLPPDQRVEVTEMLFQSISVEPDKPHWRQVLHDIADGMDRGEMKSIPADEALRYLRERAAT